MHYLSSTCYLCRLWTIISLPDGETEAQSCLQTADGGFEPRSPKTGSSDLTDKGSMEGRGPEGTDEPIQQLEGLCWVPQRLWWTRTYQPGQAEQHLSEFPFCGWAPGEVLCKIWEAEVKEQPFLEPPHIEVDWPAHFLGVRKWQACPRFGPGLQAL